MNTKHHDSYSIYPGQFIPVADEAFIIKQVKRMDDEEANPPYANVKELLDEYKIEIAAPGYEREKLIVYANKNDLLVCVTDNYNTVEPRKCFRRHVKLPDDADTELAIAEYHNNTLELYIPKAKQPCKTTTTRIIVY
jgi:HSP20 family molecular chaperone IbpA